MAGGHGEKNRSMKDKSWFIRGQRICPAYFVHCPVSTLFQHLKNWFRFLYYVKWSAITNIAVVGNYDIIKCIILIKQRNYSLQDGKRVISKAVQNNLYACVSFIWISKTIDINSRNTPPKMIFPPHIKNSRKRVIILGNGHGNSSSSLGRSCLYLSSALNSWQRHESNYSLSGYGWIVGQTSLFNFRMMTSLEEKIPVLNHLNSTKN